MKELTILHLYPKEMNLYGDHGNVLTLVRRCEWREIKARVVEYESGDKLPKNVDIIFGGGGQDSGQSKIQEDFLKIGGEMRGMIEGGVAGLFVCGMYQLLGEYFRTLAGEEIKGIGALDMRTTGGPERMTGNVVVKSREFGEIVGYENHSGRTELGKDLRALGVVKVGGGNNGRDGKEGCVHRNIIGTYLHGPILPKNPQVADWLLRRALEKKYGEGGYTLGELDDSAEWAAHRVQAGRLR